MQRERERVDPEFVGIEWQQFAACTDLEPVEAGRLFFPNKATAASYLRSLLRPSRLPSECPFGLIGAGLLLWLIGDTVYALSDFGAAYALGNPVDATWLLAYAWFGPALLHPSLASSVEPLCPCAREATTRLFKLVWRPSP
jgi:hypothetical protein